MKYTFVPGAFSVDDDLAELERVIDSQLSKGSGSWFCKSCDYSHLRKDVVRNHIEVNHVT